MGPDSLILDDNVIDTLVIDAVIKVVMYRISYRLVHNTKYDINDYGTMVPEPNELVFIIPITLKAIVMVPFFSLVPMAVAIIPLLWNCLVLDQFLRHR